MTRDARALLWSAGVLAVFAALLVVFGPSGQPPPVLQLGPEPWIGALASVAVAGLCSVLASGWMGSNPGFEDGAFGERWRPSGNRQRARTVLVLFTGYAASLGLWMLLGPVREVPLMPFLRAEPAEELLVTCSTMDLAPQAAQWAVHGMCRWNTMRWLPFLLGLVAVLVVGGVVWARRSRSRDVLGVVLDGTGLVIELESGARRVPWSQVRHAELRGPAIVVHLRDGSEVVVHLEGYDPADVELLQRRITENIQPEEALDEAEKARLAAMSVVTDR